MHISDEQNAAISANLQHNLILAGPGSGKTFVITRRVMHMVKNLNIREENILVITFTNAAACEMRLRYQALNEGKRSNVIFSTMHSIFYRMLKSINDYADTKIIDERTKERLFKYIWKTITQKDYPGYDALNKSVIEIQTNLFFKSASNTREEDELLIRFVKAYNVAKKRRKIIDFDDMIFLCYKYLRIDDSLLNKYKNRFQYILIDEFQDINLMQYEIIKLLSNKSVYAVGDDDQSIYGFRGSNPDIMNIFINDYNPHVFMLTNNYRCGSSIVNLSNKVILNNKQRQSKAIIPNRQEKGKIRLKLWANRNNQSEEVCKDIKRLNDDGIAYNNMAILVRVKISALLIIKELEKENIPYRLKTNMVNIFNLSQSEIFLSFLKLTRGSFERKDFLLALEFSSSSLNGIDINQDTITLEDIKELSRLEYDLEIKKELEIFIRDIEFISRLTPTLALSYVESKNNLISKINIKLNNNSQNATEIIFNELLDLSEKYHSIKNFLSSTVSKEDSIEDSTDFEGINIMTVHASKGLEFDCVFLPDLISGYFPGNSAADDSNNLEEERRLFYVALTRAKNNLYLYSVNNKKNNKYEMSQFISEIIR